MIGWNAVLTALDYLNFKYPNRNVYFIFPIPYFIAINGIGLLIFKISQKSTMSSRIIIGYNIDKINK